MSRQDVDERRADPIERSKPLNLEQRRVYDSKGHCIVLAGPGSGKTEILTQKLARMLIEDVQPPRGIACITYSNECVRELERRLDKLGVRRDRCLFIGTVHSFCLCNILKPYAQMAGIQLPDPIVISTEEEQKESFRFSQRMAMDRSSRVNMDRYRRTCLDRQSQEWNANNLSRLVEAYEDNLHKKGLIDFDDMALWGLQLVEQHDWIRKLLKARYPILVVDEYQDLGLPLHRMVEALCFGAGIRLLAVGDPNQSIYGFAGAQPGLLQALADRDGVEKVILKRNYRNGTKIIQALGLILDHGAVDVPENAPEGEIYFCEYQGGISEQAERICAEIIPSLRAVGYNLGEIAVLYLDKNDGDIIAASAKKHAIEFIRIDKNAPYPKTRLTRWLEDCAAWCAGGWKQNNPSLSDLIRRWIGFSGRVMVDESKTLELRRRLVSFLWLHRLTSDTTSPSLHDWLIDFQNECLEKIFFVGCENGDEYEALQKLQNACQGNGPMQNFTVSSFAGQKGADNHLNLITLHQAKGREFEVVIMMGLEQGRIPAWNDGDNEKDEKRRLFYVGISRAKQLIYMTYSGWYEDRYGRRYRNGPSQYLLELMNHMN